MRCEDIGTCGPNVPTGTLRVNSDRTVRDEQNADYNQLVDQPGRPLRLQRNFNLVVTVGGAITF